MGFESDLYHSMSVTEVGLCFDHFNSLRPSDAHMRQ